MMQISVGSRTDKLATNVTKALKPEAQPLFFWYSPWAVWHLEELKWAFGRIELLGAWIPQIQHKSFLPSPVHDGTVPGSDWTGRQKDWQTDMNMEHYKERQKIHLALLTDALEKWLITFCFLCSFWPRPSFYWIKKKFNCKMFPVIIIISLLLLCMW